MTVLAYRVVAIRRMVAFIDAENDEELVREAGELEWSAWDEQDTEFQFTVIEKDEGGTDGD